MPFQQRTNTSCYLVEIPTHGFTVVLSVFRGTPPAKPLNCKSVSNRLGARSRPAWAYHTGGTFIRSCAWIRLALSDIIKTSLCYHSRTVHLFVFGHPASFRATKNPAYFAVSRVREILNRSSKPAYTESIQNTFGTLSQGRHGYPKAKCTTWVIPAMTGRFRDRHCRPTRGCYVHASFHRTWKTNTTEAWLQSTYTFGGS